MTRQKISMKIIDKTEFLKLVCIIILLLSNSLTVLFNEDIWTHLKTGEIIVKECQIPFTDRYSCTEYGKPVPPIAWLFQILVYLIFSVGGYHSLCVFKALFFTFCFSVYALYLLKKRIPFLPILIGFIVFLIAARFRILLRPHLFSLCFTVFLLIYLKSAKSSAWWLLIPFFSLWSNLHGEVVLGFVIVSVFYIELVWNSLKKANFFPFTRKRQKKKDERLGDTERLESEIPPSILSLFHLPALAVLLLSFLGALANPAGVDILTYGAKHASYDLVYEFMPLDFSVNREVIPLLIFGGLSLVFTWKQRTFHEWLLILIFTIFSFKYQRIIPYMGIMWLPVVIDGFRWFEASRFTCVNRHIMIAIVCILALSNASLIAESQVERFGLGVHQWRFPWAIIRYLDENDITGPVLNCNEIGSFLIWTSYPGRPVFSDGRQLLFNELHARIMTFTRFSKSLEEYFDHWEEIAMEYHCDYAVAIYQSPEQRGFAEFLRKRWKLVFWDDAAMLFIRPQSRFQPIIDRDAIEGIGPEGFYQPLPSHQAIEILQRVLRRDPSVALTHYMLAFQFAKSNLKAEAISELNRALMLRPRFIPAQKLLSKLEND